jgi:hypothetical protein
MAKQSDMACTAAMRPKRKGSSTHALMKSTDWTARWLGGTRGSRAASSRRPIGSGDPDGVLCSVLLLPADGSSTVWCSTPLLEMLVGLISFCWRRVTSSGRVDRTSARFRGATFEAQPRQGIVDVFHACKASSCDDRGACKIAGGAPAVHVGKSTIMLLLVVVSSVPAAPVVCGLTCWCGGGGGCCCCCLGRCI